MTTAATPQFIGRNLGRGLMGKNDKRGLALLRLDGTTERRNPAAERQSGIPDGIYAITCITGSSPHDLNYFGVRIGDIGELEEP